MEGLKQFICKSCGQPLVRDGSNYVCNYCGSIWVADLADDIHAVQRANAWEALRVGDFEKSAELFEEIIYKDAKGIDHESHWGKALADNAICYIVDLNERKRVPTCNNITESSFLSSKEVQKAISLAPAEIAESYKKQAEYIEKVRLEWLEKARKEQPYDVFISYKESYVDENGNKQRTQDSHDAQEIYTALLESGYKVFFSRYSLQGKPAEQYEPYIYNAIKTAKVMIVFGEKPEHFSATWVKNEWSRFRARIEKGEKHKNSLVVVVKDMEESDLPVALKSRQALNMSNITFLGTLKNHIKRVVDESKQGVRLDKIEIKGGQRAKKATTLEVNTIKTREIGSGATVKIDITEKATLSLVSTYMKAMAWEEATKLIDDILFNNPSCTEALWKQLLIKYGATDNTSFTLKIPLISSTDFQVIDQILSRANQEIATEILDLLYSSYTTVNDERYSTVLKLILPYQYKNRQAKIDNAFIYSIENSANKTFELLLTSIDANDVDSYIDYNIKYLKKSKSSAEKAECIDRILKVDEGNVNALQMLLYSQLENNEQSKKVINTFETLLKYSNNGQAEIGKILNWLKRNIDSADDCLLARQILRYSSEDISVYKDTLIALSSTMISCGFFEDAQYFSSLILGFDSLNDKAYWNICLIRTHSSKEQNIILSDILLKTIPEYTKYLTLVDEKRRFQCIELQKRQEQAFNRRKQKREEEQRLLAEKEEEDRRRREAEARARRKHRIKNISIASLVVAFAISITLFFSMFLPMFFLNNGKLGAYVKYKNLTEFEIPEGTTQIDSNEFKGCGSLTSITIPNSVNRIGDYAFKNCSLLTSVVIGDGVTEIGQHAFNGCGSLTSIEMGVNVESIGSGAFEGCSSLTSITIPDRVTTIGNSAFYDCSSLTSITIPNSVTLIGASAFYGCSSLEEMVIPFVGMTKDGTTNTGFSYIFIGHGGNNHMVPKSLKKVTINAGSIGNRAFANCSSLTTVIVGNGVTSIGEDAFYACSLLTSVQIADSVTLIGSGAFKLCTSLEEITIPFVGETKVGIGETHFGYILGVISSQHNDFVPTSLKKVTVTGGKIVSHAFRDCTSLTSIVIGDGVTSIGSGAFYGCSSLTSIVIGDGVTSIGDYVFDDTAYYNDESNWENGILYIGKYLIKAKTTISGSYSVKEGTLCVANEAFRNCSSLTSIIIPDSVTSIGDDAFTACFSLTIYAEAESKPSGWGSKWNGSNRPVIWNFKGYGTQSQDFEYYVTNDNKAHLTKYKGSASEVVIPESLGNATVTSIEDSAFYNCSSLVSVVIPDSVTTIEANAFTGCSSLTSITVSEKNEHYSSLNGDLYNKAKTSLIKYAIGKQDAFFAIPNSVTMIATGAFDGCNSLNSIEIGDSVIAIEVGAFDGCNSLMEITIPFVGSTKDGVDNTYFGYIFSGNNNNLPKSLKKVTVTGGKIANNAFYGCSSLTSVVIGDNVTSIGNGAFDGCISLEEIIVPFVGATKDGTTNTHFGYIFGAYSSSDNDNYVPTSLKKVTVSGGKIANSAFSGCDSLTSIEIGDNVTSIGNDAFDGCYRLVEVVNKSTHITIEKGSWDNGNVGYYALAVYNNSDNFGGTKLSTDNGCVIYTDGTEKILVSYIGNETQLIIPSYITQINDYAFYKCRSLTSVKMGDRVTSIGEKAFYWCTSLASIKIPNSVISIGSQAFESCISLTSIEIPNSVTSIDASAFYNTAYYNNEENWENGVLYIGKYLIQAKTTVSSDYSVKEGTLLIGDYAFCYCSSLTSVEIGDSITSIGSYAFNNCTSLTSVEIPNSVTSIGYSAFEDCSSLTSVVIPNSVTSIGNCAFEDCSSLTSIEIPAGVTSIGWHAFYGCSSLTSIVIPSRVTFIDNYAFASCKTLTIYCEASSQPSGWEKNWNYSDRPVYWYRETQPTTSGNYWHYVNGVPTKW